MTVTKVALIGYGGIGRSVASAILGGHVPNVELVGTVVRTPGPAQRDGVRELRLATALGAADLLVEVAGQGAVRQYGPETIRSGKDLLIVSVGALAQSALREQLLAPDLPGAGNLFVTNGAIGGLDLLGAITQVGEVQHVRLTTRKLPRTLVQPWMDSEQVTSLQQSTGQLAVP